MRDPAEYFPLLWSPQADQSKISDLAHIQSDKKPVLDTTATNNTREQRRDSRRLSRTKAIVAMVAIPAILLASSAVIATTAGRSLESYYANLTEAPSAETTPVAPSEFDIRLQSSGPFDSVRGPLISSNFPDPAIYWEDGVTYAFATNNKREKPVGYAHVPVAILSSNQTWEILSQDALPRVGAWAAGTNVWAPDVVKVADGSYVLYYTDSIKGREQSHCLGVATSNTILGPYSPLETAWICPDPATKGGAIDPDGFYDASTGKRYVTYKVDGNSIGHGGNCNNDVAPIVPTPILLQEVGPDGISLIGEPIPILDRDQSDGPLVEAPALYRSDEGIYFLFFSSNCFTTPLYDVLYATATNIAGPYTRASRPLLISGDGPGLVGPGGLDIAPSSGSMLLHGHLTPENSPVLAKELEQKALELGKPVKDVERPFLRGMYGAAATFRGHEVSLGSS